MRNYRGILALAILTTVLLLGGFLSFRQSAQDHSASNKDEPTVIQEGVMTERQKKNSKLYNQHEKSRSLIGKVEKDLQIVIGEPYPVETSDTAGRLSQNSFVSRLTCSADTVLIGKVGSKTSQLSEDRKSVFTDYAIEITELIKEGKAGEVKNTKTITVTRSGGAVKFRGHVIEVFDKSYRLLKVGSEYLLFLKYVNESDSFRTSDVEGTFEVEGSKARRFTDTSIKYEQAENGLISFVSEIKIAAKNCY